MLTEDKIQSNYDEFMRLINSDHRKDKLIQMYNDYGQELILAPASSKSHFHSAWPSGYLDHVLRVTKTAVSLSKMYATMGGTIDFTVEEAIFAAMHHDLGKLGEPDNPYYIEQTSSWHRERGEMYTHNEALPFMKVADRALFILQKYNIPVSYNEWIGIKFADGLYDDSNKSYLINYSHKNPVRTNLGAIIHLADYISCRVESDQNPV